MTIELVRKWFTDRSTIGGMMIDGRFSSFTLEDRARAAGVKIPGKTCIPVGHYSLIVNFSTRFQRYLPLLINVPMFSGVRIHSGNTDADTEGCILLGNSKGEDCILDSRLAFAEFFDTIAVKVGEDDEGIDIWRTKEPTVVIITNEAISDTRSTPS